MAGYVATFSYQAAVSHAPQFSPGTYRHFSVTPATGAIGAVIEGIDLANASDEAIGELERALTDHIALMIRDQDLEPADQVNLARRLGTPLPWPYAQKMEGFPEITELIQEPGDKYAFGGTWHSDSCNFERPPKYTMAYAVACPPVGGDTAFSNQYLAWETLDEALKTELASVRCINSSALGYGTASIDQEVTDNTATPIVYSADQFNEVLHPVCRTHPVTGRKALYTNDSFTARFEGRSQQESLPLLRRLWRHSIIPEFTCRLSWKPKSLAIWDNRCCLHYAHSDYPGHRRHLRRIVIEGERPF
ncbi:MAG: TauD/TfdA family dioxygenase [bacterium]|nr:TauD/TfdA family dioxygenase [bacterium]MDE0239504.1 TauD/TfdA family dioxygenase [bacterium]